MSALIEKLEALSAKATKAPWRVRDDVIYFASWISADDGEADLGAIGESWPMQHREEAEADAALIVELVNNLPEIIKALKATSMETDNG